MTEIKGKLEDWRKLRKLALRTNLGNGTAKIDGKEIKFSFSLNIDNQAIFVEFPDLIVVTYSTSDIIEDALEQYKVYLKQQQTVGAKTP